MTHMNIQHPDEHQFGDVREQQISRLQAELKYLQAKYNNVCEDLRSIYDRCDAGEEVYFERPGGGLMHIQKVPESD